MKQLEGMIKKIESIDSKGSLDQFFLNIESEYHYLRAGLIVFEPCLSKKYSSMVYGRINSNMEDFIKQDDNIKRHCLNESVPITYQDLLSPDNASERPSFTENIFDRNQFELIVPINGFGGEFACLLFSISKHAMQPNLLEKLGWYWLLLSAFIYSRYRKNIAQSQPKITKRELECIKWASEGKTSWEISQLLRISQRTVDFHLTNCIAKTNSINRQQAIVKCIFNGQLLAI